MQTSSYTVTGMSCEHCKAAIEEEVAGVAGVVAVDADLETKIVRVEGTVLDDAAIRAAIAEAGYDVDAPEPPAAA